MSPVNTPPAAARKTPTAAENAPRRPAPHHADDAPTFTVFVPGKPAAQGSKRHIGGGRLIEQSKAVAPWRKTVARVLADTMPEPLDGPTAIQADFVMPRPKATPKTKPTPAAVKRPDLDKMLRAILDAGTGIAWRDDSQVVVIAATKRIAELDELPGVTLTITTTEETQ